MKIALVAVAVAMMLPDCAAVAQTAQDREACMGDVMRLCASAIPSRGRVIACMLQNRSRLGSQCRAVVARYTGQYGRDAQPKPAVEQTVSLQ